jgi:hypothetical protein
MRAWPSRLKRSICRRNSAAEGQVIFLSTISTVALYLWQQPRHALPKERDEWDSEYRSWDSEYRRW